MSAPGRAGPNSADELPLDAELLWLIERVDTIRLGTESRASMALSAAALLLGGITFVLNNSLLSPGGLKLGVISKILIVTTLSASLAAVLASVVMATAAIVNVFTTSRRLAKNAIPSRVFIHSWDTMFVHKDFESFRRGYEETSRSQFRTACIAYLWTSHHLYMKRYLSLRRAIRSLLLALTLFVCGVAVVMANTVIR